LSYIKEEFDNAYSMLEDKLYKCGAYNYKELKGYGDEADKILLELIELKGQVDSRMKYFIRTIYKKLKIEYGK